MNKNEWNRLKQSSVPQTSTFNRKKFQKSCRNFLSWGTAEHEEEKDFPQEKIFYTKSQNMQKKVYF